MKALLTRLWGDQDYFIKTMVVVIGGIVTTLPLLPLGELGPAGYWISKYLPWLIVAWGATGKGSGLSADEAAKLRALIPTQDVLDKKAPLLKPTDG